MDAAVGVSNKEIDLSLVPELDEKQVGSIRHIKNLSNLPKNDWSFMMPYLPMQEDHGAYRYQLGYMAFALALGHRHRLPAAPALFKRTFENLIEKMVHPEVWLYWRDTSRAKGHNALDAPELPSEVDPIRRDNIMYSAYIQVMTLMYHALFNDDKYTKKDSIEFTFAPIMCLYDQHVTYGYDENKINNAVYWNMVQSGYLGVACEPYCVFQICNQVPILGFRLHDWLNGGNTAEEVIEGHVKAWQEFGGALADDGHYITFIQTHTMTAAQGETWGAWSDSWCAMLMNTWNSEFVRNTYEKQVGKWLEPKKDGAISVVIQETPDGMDIPLGAWGDYGWVVGCLSEMGDEANLKGVLEHADRYMNPTWHNGGYFYPRNDDGRDAEGNLIAMSPTIGNAMLQYARLNVNDGLKKFYEEPWEEGHFSKPAIVSAPEHLDFSRAVFLPEENALVATMKTFNGSNTPVEIEISNVPEGKKWLLSFDGEDVARSDGSGLKTSESVAVQSENSCLKVRFDASRQTTMILQFI